MSSAGKSGLVRLKDHLVGWGAAAFLLGGGVLMVWLTIGLLLLPFGVVTEAGQAWRDVAGSVLAAPAVIWLRATVGDATFVWLGVFLALSVVWGLAGDIQDARALKKYQRDIAAHYAAYPDVTTPEARAAWNAREHRGCPKAIRWGRGFKRLGVVALGLLALMLWALDLTGLVIFGLIAAAFVWVVRWIVTGFRADPQ